MQDVTRTTTSPNPSTGLDSAGLDHADAAPSDAGSSPDAVSQDASTSRSVPLDRRRILDATESCLIEKAYDGTTIRQIAIRLDCAVGSIYRYFKDKRDLLTAVTQRRFEAVAEHVDLGTPIQRSTGLYYRVAMERPELYQLMFWLTSVGRPGGETVLPHVIERIIEGWAQQVGGEARARQLWAALHAGVTLGLPLDEALVWAPMTRRDAGDTSASSSAGSASHDTQADTQSESEAAAMEAEAYVTRHASEASAGQKARREDLTLL